MPHQPNRPEFPGLIALLAGALAIGSSGIFVRVSETGPTATAFWRGCLALPLLAAWAWLERRHRVSPAAAPGTARVSLDRKSTRLNSSHVAISYAVFCLKKKKKKKNKKTHQPT